MAKHLFVSSGVTGVLVVLAGCTLIPANQTQVYDPQINAANFVPGVTNKYFTLTPGRTFVYEGETSEGTERIEVFVTRETKEVLGVKTTVVWDRVWLNDELIEDTRDWYAQDRDGNVWYFGEDTKEMENGEVVSTVGSWEAGVDGAKPGMVMEGSPEIGDSYRQEFYAGTAEDMGDVVALGQSVEIPYGTFNDCLKTRDWTPLEAKIDEHKYYCVEVAGLVLEEGIYSNERVMLVGIKSE